MVVVVFHKVIIWWFTAGIDNVHLTVTAETIAAATTNDLFLLKQETVSGSGISWAIMQICTSLQTDNQALIPKKTYLSDRDYIMRMLYKNCY